MEEQNVSREKRIGKVAGDRFDNADYVCVRERERQRETSLQGLDLRGLMCFIITYIDLHTRTTYTHLHARTHRLTRTLKPTISLELQGQLLLAVFVRCVKVEDIP